MFVNIPSATLKELVKLSERKEALMARIQDLDREMVRLQSTFSADAKNSPQGARVTVTAAPARSTGPRAKRGALKEKILQALRAAGKKGVTIGQLSKKLKVRSANLYVWFNGTGRNVRVLKKIGPAKFRLG